jgi:hypothetical protein
MLILLVVPTADTARAVSTFEVRFDEGLHAESGAASPFSASNGVEIIDAPGARGRAARFGSGGAPLPAKLPAPASWSGMIFGGADLPISKGSVSLRIRPATDAGWQKGRREWLLCLPPLVGERGFQSNEKGTSLSLVIDGKGQLVLAIHDFRDGRLTADYRRRKMHVGISPPDAEPISIPLPVISDSGWLDVILAWDMEADRLWLAVGDRVEEASRPLVASERRALLVGVPPRINDVEEEFSFAGLIDEIIVRDEPDTAIMGEREGPGAMARHRSAASGAPAKRDSSWTMKVERAARRHLEALLAARGPAGWAPVIAWPSNLRFLSAKTVLPYSDRLFLASTRSSSVRVAIDLLSAFDVLGDSRYLAAARSVADLELRLQGDTGAWPAQALIGPGEQIRRYNPREAPFKDGVQSMPITLLWHMYDLTGETKYWDAAKRGLDFIAWAQNENGSWPNRVNLVSRKRESMSSVEGAGELNDFATSGSMNLMLLRYRLTGEVEYLARYLRGADWIADAFLEGGARGWAKSYDADNRPIPGRHHEPAAIALQEMDDVPRTLLEAYELTADERYRVVLKRWSQWMRSKRLDSGWYPFYDVKTGQPVRYRDRKRVSLRPSDVADHGMTKVLSDIRVALERPRAVTDAEDSFRARLVLARGDAVRAVESMDARSGTWLSVRGPQGPAFSPATNRLHALLHALVLTRESTRAKPDERPDLTERGDWDDYFGRIMPAAQRFAPLSEGTIREARQWRVE